MHKIYWLVVGLMIISTSCSKENLVYIDPELEVYFTLFQQEAAERGIEVDYQEAQIEGYIDDLEGENASGGCATSTDGQKRVIIDPDYWNAQGSTMRIFIVFHELGHCFLHREHLDEQHTDGTCVSMMHSTSSACTNAFSNETSEAYFDELFNP